jgi:hypothetical protein|nr:MAG TPA: hypothetical protein [Caudoviricetes sp.]
MKKYQEPNYNIDGVDLNIYTVKRDDDIEYYADRLDYLKEFHKDKYNMIAMIIEMTSIIEHDVITCNDKNMLISKISRMESKKNIKVIKNIVSTFDK